MRTTITTALLAGVAAAAALVVPGAAAAPTAAAPSVDLQPQTLARGPDVAVAHVEDGVLVDGERRLDLPGNDGDLLGASGDAWIVAVWTTTRVGEQRRARVVRVEPDGAVRTIFVGDEAGRRRVVGRPHVTQFLEESGVPISHRSPPSIRAVRTFARHRARVGPMLPTGMSRSWLIDW